MICNPHAAAFDSVHEFISPPHPPCCVRTLKAHVHVFYKWLIAFERLIIDMKNYLLVAEISCWIDREAIESNTPIKASKCIPIPHKLQSTFIHPRPYELPKI